MQRIEFSELTNRLRRNLMGAAFLIVVIAGFDIRVGKVLTSGLELQNLTTEVVLKVLLGFLIYHFVAFSIHAYEEFRLWELKPAAKLAQERDRHDVLEMVGPMTDTRKAMDMIQSAMKEQHQLNVITKEDFVFVNNALEGGFVYNKHFEKFPTITRFRFWVLDIGIAVVMLFVAILFGGSFVQAGRLSYWLL